MSAFILSHKHINSLVAFAAMYRNNCHIYIGQRMLNLAYPEDAQTAAEILYHENEKSVSYRYDDTDASDLPGKIGEAGTPIKFSRKNARQLSPVEALKACASYEYQSSERPDWKQSEARTILERIRYTAISHLPGYEEAPWAID